MKDYFQKIDSGIKKNLLLIIFFGIAMGFLEAIIVVYLRELYYQNGFNFPLELIPEAILFAEIVRELCTMIMLITIALLAGRNKLEIFSYFLFSFAIWDIFYYIALKLFLNWPESFLTWDILFLIPVTWISPVLAPIICSVLMIILALCILYFSGNKDFIIKKIEWIMIWSSALIIFISFIWDFQKLLLPNFVPDRFQWEIFSVGILLVIAAIILMIKRSRFAE
jgi:hypothetical protein